MFDQNNLKKIKETIEEFFQKMSFEVKIELSTPKKTLIEGKVKKEVASLPINLKVENPRILIGEKGEVLFEIQHLLKVILKRKIENQDFYLDLDINDYKKKKINYLKELARELANEVFLTKKEKILPPMPPFERRIIHLELTNHPNVTTESIGQEPERRVVIKPYS